MDTDGDGYLTIKEVKRLMKNKQCPNMPRGVSRRILKMADEDGDGRLDFEEFFRLSQEHDWLMGHYVARYCHWLVPDPHRELVSADGSPDQIGEVEGGFLVFNIFITSKIGLSKGWGPESSKKFEKSDINLTKYISIQKRISNCGFMSPVSLLHNIPSLERSSKHQKSEL